MNETIKVIKKGGPSESSRLNKLKPQNCRKYWTALSATPNAMNQQKWHFTVIQNKAVLDRMVEIIKENILNLGNDFMKEKAGLPSYHTFYNAPTVILISALEEAPWVQVDCGLAAENITLAAEAQNIGSLCHCLLSNVIRLGKGEHHAQRAGPARRVQSCLHHRPGLQERKPRDASQKQRSV
ncbi:MAG: nitroreductase family protein [Candidatus Syntrophopropionicum ammoniitolerans]